MKNLFLTIVNNSLFSYAKRLAILCVLFSISLFSFAWSGKATAEAAVATGSTGSGTVYVSKDNIEPTSGGTTSDKLTSVSKDIDDDNPNTIFYWWANADKNNIFDGWYTDGSMSEGVDKQEDFSETLSGSDNNRSPIATYYASFKQVIAPKEANVAFTEIDQPRITEIELYKATNFSFAVKTADGNSTENLTAEILSSNVSDAGSGTGSSRRRK